MGNRSDTAEKHGEMQVPVGSHGWNRWFGRRVTSGERSEQSSDAGNWKARPEKWSLGILNDPETEEVPGSVLLMSHSAYNQPLGIRNQPARTSASSLPSPYPHPSRPESIRSEPEVKKTSDGQIVLEPQPDDSPNDPLNWPTWRRDTALLSLGFYCMVGGGMTPILAAGFNAVASDYHVTVPRVALTTGLYMMGLGIGSVIWSPTAILYGKRPVYLVGVVLFCLCAVWAALSPNFASLVVARIVMGIAVAPCECLPSATIAEIFFLHERAYRVGIYTLLLLGGKNLIPLVSAAIIEAKGWRWVFWIVAIVVGLCFLLLFLFVPETFWNRTPRPKRKPTEKFHRTFSSLFHHDHTGRSTRGATPAAAGNASVKAECSPATIPSDAAALGSSSIMQRRRQKAAHVGFAQDTEDKTTVENAAGSNLPEMVIPVHDTQSSTETPATDKETFVTAPTAQPTPLVVDTSPSRKSKAAHFSGPSSPASHSASWRVEPSGQGPPTPDLHRLNSPYYAGLDANDYFKAKSPTTPDRPARAHLDVVSPGPVFTPVMSPRLSHSHSHTSFNYTADLDSRQPKTFVQTLRPWNGRLRKDNWFRVACRPFILFAYPAVLWSSFVYACSVGWLIVLSESVSTIFEKRTSYGFSPLSVGLIYISPFIGGVLGTAVAGKVSDVIVRYMSRKNGGIYEPEFRLVMAIPVAFTTAIGLMGYGWSAQEHDKWIVPTIFFGLISFGCSLGSTTSITFVVDSYRQYAGEALVTLNFSKNIFHGLVFSLFFNNWLDSDGSRKVFLILGGIQLAVILFTIPLYIYGKRARMWTVRINLMEKF